MYLMEAEKKNGMQTLGKFPESFQFKEQLKISFLHEEWKNRYVYNLILQIK